MSRQLHEHESSTEKKIVSKVSLPSPSWLSKQEELLHAKNFGVDQLPLHYAELFKVRSLLELRLRDASYRLKQIYPVSFQFYDKGRRQAVREELLFIFYVTSAQYCVDGVEKRRQNLPFLAEQIKKTAFLLECLDMAEYQDDAPATPKDYLLRYTATLEKCTPYLGLLIGDFIAGKVKELIQAGKQEKAETEKTSNHFVGITHFLTKWIKAFNEQRLYGVWSLSLVSTIMELLPNERAADPQVDKAFTQYWKVNGYLSWILYFAKFAIDIGLVMKHIIPVKWWMHPEEQKIPLKERAHLQWETRKYSLINYGVWGCANMVCFFWLCGAGTLGYLGGVAVIALQMMDAMVIFLQYLEEQKQHIKIQTQYEMDIRALRERCQSLAEREHISEELINEANKLNRQLGFLEDSYRRYQLNWHYQHLHTINDLVYANALFFSFAMACTFLLPPVLVPAAIATVMTVVGFSLCFGITIANVAVHNALNMMQSFDTGAEIEETKKQLIEQFRNTESENEKKIIYLDIQGLSAQSDYQVHLLHHQKLQLVRRLLADLFVPSLLFVSAVFLPFSMALAVVGAGLLLTLVSRKMLNVYMPHENELELNDKKTYEFDEKQYEDFKKNPDKVLKRTSSREGFFKEDYPLSPKSAEPISYKNWPLKPKSV